MIKNYRCDRCEQLLQSDRQPSSFGCTGNHSHLWRDLGPVGTENYVCDRCGLLVEAQRPPTSFGCRGGHSHLWRHQGSRAERPARSSGGGSGGSHDPVTVHHGESSPLTLGCVGALIAVGLAYAIGSAAWDRFTKHDSPAPAPPTPLPSVASRPLEPIPSSAPPVGDVPIAAARPQPLPATPADAPPPAAQEVPQNQPPPVAPAVPVMELSPEAVMTDVVDKDLLVMARRFQKRYAGTLVRFTETVVRKNPREQLLVFKGGGFLATAYDVQARLADESTPRFDEINVGDRITLLGTLDRLVTAPFGLGGNSIRIQSAQVVKRQATPSVVKRRK